MNTNQEKLTKAIARERKHIKNKSRNLLFTSIISIVVLLALWELSVQLGWITTRFFCAPSEVLNALIEKLTNRAPDGATLPVHILENLHDRFFDGGFNRNALGASDGMVQAGG